MARKLFAILVLGEEKKLPGVRHVVVQTATPERAAEFYKSVFELREISNTSDGSLRQLQCDVTVA